MKSRFVIYRFAIHLTLLFVCGLSSYTDGVQGTTCYTVYQRANINKLDPYGILAVSRQAVCQGPADAFNGSAVAWCVSKKPCKVH